MIRAIRVAKVANKFLVNTNKYRKYTLYLILIGCCGIKCQQSLYLPFTLPCIAMKYKICTSIATSDFNEALRLISRNHMVELRLDLMQVNNEQLRFLLQQGVETIATFRGEKYSESERLQALVTAIDSGSSYVDVEEESNEQYRQQIVQHARHNGCKVVISYHNFECTPDVAVLKNIIQDCRSKGADIVKLITTASCAADSARVLSLYENEENLVAFAMGEEGKISRFACLFLGAPFTYASAVKGSEVAPGQLVAQDMQQMIQLMYPAKAKVFAVAGKPILHSRSPILFGAAYDNPANDYAFFRMAVESGEEFVQLFRELGLSGANVTAPFKAEVAKLVDYCSEEVTVLQAANTLVEKNGKLHAYNTDIYGVVNSLEAKGINIVSKRCVVLGAGGAGCAAAYALKKAGAAVTIVNRTVHKAKAFAEKIDCAYSGLDKVEELLTNADILVSTLTADVVDERWLNPQLVILDAVYHGSTLKQKAENRGCTYIDGNQWLLHQGIPGYKLFTGEEPDSNEMAVALSSTSLQPTHISFIGFMGSGKSTVAYSVAKMLGMPVVDADRELEHRHGETISQMIKSKGEAYFRKQEQLMLKELLSRKIPSIISCGGGIITQPEMCKMLKSDSIVIYLYAPPGECLKRINVQSRPMLAQHEDPQKVADDIFEQRKTLYLQTAWLLINTSGRSIEQVSKIVYEEISKCIGG